MLMQCNVVGQPQRRNPTSSTEVIGHIIDKSQPSTDVETTTQHSDIVALCTLDGECVYIRVGVHTPTLLSRSNLL